MKGGGMKKVVVFIFFCGLYMVVKSMEQAKSDKNKQCEQTLDEDTTFDLTAKWVKELDRLRANRSIGKTF